VAHTVVGQTTYSVQGTIVDIRKTERGDGSTNQLSVSGITDGGHFTLDVVPVKTEDEIAESVGWDGSLFRLIQRYPKWPGMGQPRDQFVGVVEPTPFSWYMSHASASAVFGLVDTSVIQPFLSGDGRFTILGGLRNYPEENNTYRLDHVGAGGYQLVAHSPGIVVRGAIEDHILGWRKGFKRWTISVTNESLGAREFRRKIRYQRFYPAESGLFLYRDVESVLTFSDTSDLALADKAWVPEIVESALPVRDYTGRFDFMEYSEGRVDSPLVYLIEDGTWADKTQLIKENFDKFRQQMGTNKVPTAVVSAAATPKAYHAPRSGLLVGVLFCLAIPIGYFLVRNFKQ